MTPAIDWTRATVAGALLGGAFWAIAVQALIASEGSLAAWTTIGVAVVGILGAGLILFRRTTIANTRCYAVGMILAPLAGLVPAAVFGLAAIVAEVVA